MVALLLAVRVSSCKARLVGLTEDQSQQQVCRHYAHWIDSACLLHVDMSKTAVEPDGGEIL